MQEDPFGTQQGHPIRAVDARNVSASLEEVENEIYHEVGRIISSKLHICLLLARIMSCRYYRQAGYGDFKSYLKAERIPINYKTACGYARIGELAQTYEKELIEGRFTEEDGIEKLKYLEIALRNYPAQKELVFLMLKTSSFRSFLSFAKGKSTKRVPNCRPRVANGSTEIPACRLRVEDDTITVQLPNGSRKDVVWLNPDAFDRFSQYEYFTEELLKVVESYFCDAGDQ